MGFSDAAEHGVPLSSPSLRAGEQSPEQRRQRARALAQCAMATTTRKKAPGHATQNAKEHESPTILQTGCLLSLRNIGDALHARDLTSTLPL